MEESKLIYKKMADILKEIGSIPKNRTNTQGFTFKFRGIDDFQNSLHPLLAKHEVFMAPRATKYETVIKEVDKGGGKKGYNKHVSILMEYDFYAVDGSVVTVGPIPSEGLDQGDKATNKALSAGLKYCLIQTFMVPTEDQVDGDSESPEILPEYGIDKSAPTISVPVYEERDLAPQQLSGIEKDIVVIRSLADSITKPKTIPKPPLTNLSSYQVNFGKFKGKKLSDIGPDILKGYLSYIKGDKFSPPLEGPAKEFYEKGTAYLKSTSGN